MLNRYQIHKRDAVIKTDAIDERAQLEPGESLMIDRLTTLGRETLDPVKRQEIYARIQRKTAADLPFLEASRGSAP